MPESSDFGAAFAWTLGVEGGESDVVGDPGGHTYQGVTQTTYDAYRLRKRETVRSVALMESHEVWAIYRKFWEDAKCDLLPYPVNAVVFDVAINSGALRARRMLQEALGVRPDGIIGPKTLAALSAQEPQKVALELLWVRLRFYVELARLPTLAKFLRGWVAHRVIALRDHILQSKGE